MQSWFVKAYSQMTVVFPSFHKSDIMGAKKLIMIALMLTTGLTNERGEMKSKCSDLIKPVGFISVNRVAGH